MPLSSPGDILVQLMLQYDYRVVVVVVVVSRYRGTNARNTIILWNTIIATRLLGTAGAGACVMRAGQRPYGKHYDESHQPQPPTAGPPIVTGGCVIAADRAQRPP